jgi:hypothetical protein
VIRKSVKKTGRNDARALAFFLSKDMLPKTRLKSQAEGELASLVHSRDVLVKQRTRLLNKIHALHVCHGLKLKKESLSSKGWTLPASRHSNRRAHDPARPGAERDGGHRRDRCGGRDGGERRGGGLSGISCQGGHNGKKGASFPWPDAKTRLSPMQLSTSFWPAPIQRRSSTLMAL